MTPEEAKDRSRGRGGDMSPEMIARRLDIVSELREWCALLATAREVGRKERPRDRACPATSVPPTRDESC